MFPVNAYTDFLYAALFPIGVYTEIYITNNIIELLQNGQASSINGTKYVLFEFPLITTRPMNDKEVIYRLVENGYIPIIAHPERYPFIQENQ